MNYLRCMLLLVGGGNAMNGDRMGDVIDRILARVRADGNAGMKYPWMPLFWGDFLANTMHLSAQEAGAYLFLIAHAWEHDGKIPAEHVRLARIAHVRQDQWKKVWCALQEFFEIEAHGPSITTITHGRVVNELDRLGKISNKRKDAALHKHGKSNGSAPTSTSTTNRESSLGESSEPRLVQMHTDFRDKGDDYRCPPSTKSDNVLKPLPDKQAFRRAQKQVADNKSPEQNLPQELAAKSGKE
jgi:uncharacterized protein YdaU (DUF1376 family)